MKSSTKAGVGVAVALAAAAGYFFFYSKNADQNRKKLRGWMLKLKAEVVDKLETVKTLNQETFYAVIDDVAARYGKVKSIDQKELSGLVADLKRHWKNLKTEIVTETAGTKPKARKTTKKAK
jgi:hypothetical protein